MSIEDVDYMKQNSLKENYTFIVDSRHRNHSEYPEPNNYVINFDIPFKNVFGIEILDVTIPKTMYNVDIDSNYLKIYINTTKKSIENYINIAGGLLWKNIGLLKPLIGNEIINFELEEKLKQSINLTKTEWYNFNITNLSSNNYIKVSNKLKWININDMITNDNIKIDNSELSDILTYKTEFTENEWNNLDINNINSYNYIGVLDYLQKPYLKWLNVGNIMPNNSTIGVSWINMGYDIPLIGNEYINDNLSNTIKNLSNIIGLKWENLGIIEPENGILIINTELSNILMTKTELSIGEWNNINIVFNISNYIKSDIYYFKPISDVINLEISILQNLNFSFNIDIEDYIKVALGLKWKNMGTNIQNISDNDIEIFSENLKTIFDNASDNNYYEFTYNEWINIGINNLNNKNYIISSNKYWKPVISYYKPNGEWIRNTKLENGLKQYNLDFGLKWKMVTTKPTHGREIINQNLSEMLISKNIFTLSEWNSFNITDLQNTDYILSSDGITYYKPKEIEFTEEEWNNFNINNNLYINNFIRSENNYFKILPTYYYIPEIYYYKPDDKYDIKNEEHYEIILNNFFEKFEIYIPIGNYTLNKLILAINEQFRIINSNIKYRDQPDNTYRFLDKSDEYELLLQCMGNSSPADLTNILKFQSSRKIIFDMNNSTCDEMLGFFSKVSNDVIYKNNFIKLEINNSVNYDKFYHSIDDNNNNNIDIIISPGIVYLIGSKYILLKCPEIEQHLYGSFSYTKNTIGLAKLRTSHWGLNEDTNTFFKLPLREFHPLGKLDRLTLRFENIDGSLYNFRGVNHDIIFAIHYYIPKQQKILEKSIINPEYKMNYMDYKYTQEDQESETSSEDENNYSKINIDNYKNKEIKYDNDIYNNGYEIDYNKLRQDAYKNKSESDESD